MPRFHVRPDGTVGECKTPEKCPWKDEPHFNSFEEAEEYRDKIIKDNNGVWLVNSVGSLSLVKVKTVEEKIAALEEKKKTELEAINKKYNDEIDALKKEQ